MSGVELKVCDGEAKSNILLPIGKTVIGRGPFLSVADKRVSRNHAILEVDDGKLKIMSTHTNPTFCLEGSGENLSPLPKDTWHSLGNGDRFSLLPDQHIYEVVIDDRPINKDSQGFTLNTTLSPVKNKEENKEKEEVVKTEDEKNGESSKPEENKSNGQEKESELDTEEDKQDEQTAEIEQKEEEKDENLVVLPSGKSVALPLNKERNLPTWMLGSDSATKENPKGRGRGRAKKVTNSDDVTDVAPPKPKPKGRGRGRGRPSSGSKPAPKKTPKRDIEYLDDWMGSDEDDDDDDEGSDWEEENKKEQAKRRGSQSRFTRSPTKKSSRKRSSRRTSSDDEIEDLMDEEVYIPRPTKRGRNASRSSLSQSYEEEDEEEAVVVKKKKEVKKGKTKDDSSQGKDSERAPCTYGKKCYRKNQKHFEEYGHPGDDDYVEEDEEDEKEDDPPECTYGSDCYRKNKQHFKEYKHSKKDENKRPRRQAAEAAKKNVGEIDEDEEDDEPNTYDRKDSFIADSEETPKGAASDGSDCDANEDSEDVKNLVKEAKGFIKNKKMQKKVR